MLAYCWAYRLDAAQRQRSFTPDAVHCVALRCRAAP